MARVIIVLLSPGHPELALLSRSDFLFSPSTLTPIRTRLYSTVFKRGERVPIFHTPLFNPLGCSGGVLTKGQRGFHLCLQASLVEPNAIDHNSASGLYVYYVLLCIVSTVY